MNPEDSKNQDKLNTIYEEFDLSDRIKSLKGKHIKIKKIVKKEDGNYSIRESSLFSEKSIDPANQIGSGGYLQETNYQSSNILSSDIGFAPIDSNLFKKNNDYNSKPLRMNTSGENNLHLSHTNCNSGYNRLPDYSAPRDLGYYDHPVGFPGDSNGYSSSIGSSNLGRMNLNFEKPGARKSINIDKELSRGGSDIFGKSNSAKKQIGGGSVFKGQQMYQSNYIDESQKRGLKHANTIGNDNAFMSEFDTKSKLSNMNMKMSNYNEMPLSQYYDNVLNSRARDRDRSRENNQMFRSQTFGNNKAPAMDKQEINRDIKSFSLPPEIVKFLDEEPILFADLKEKIRIEKSEIDDILNKLTKSIQGIIEHKRVSLKKVFDEYIDNYEKTRDHFVKKINMFKDTTKVLNANKFQGSTDRLM